MKLRALLPSLALAAVACKGGSSNIDADTDPNDDGGGDPIDAPPGTQPDADLSCTAVAGEPALGVQQIATDLDMPVYVGSPPGDPRLFVLEKTGAIRIIDGGVLLPTPFLEVDTPSISSFSDERGLLGLAFHPDYAQNRKFYVFYTNPSGDTAVEQYLAREDNANLADADSGQMVFAVLDDFAGNHNGGTLQFSPTDGYLYVGIGDGGHANDRYELAQDLDSQFGKILRYDVSTIPGTVPASNPFVGEAGLDEIWSYGWRNPWRFSFDRQTGDMYIGDVGQNRVEEVDVEPAGAGGRNYGWDNHEGTECFTDNNTPEPTTPSDCDQPYTAPVYEYTTGCTVVGGYVSRGCRMPGHHGRYFFAEYCSGWVRSFRWDGGGGVTAEQEHDALEMQDIVSFGEDFQGELYIVQQDPGTIYKIIPQ